MDTQEREQKIYGFFQDKALNGGITTVDFRNYLKDNPDVNLDEYGYDVIKHPDARFRKMVAEFSDILTKQKEGNMCRYFLDSDAANENLYCRHLGIRLYISRHLGKRGFLITYTKYNGGTHTITFYPEYKRTFNEGFFVYGTALDSDGNKFDIVNGIQSDIEFTRLDINQITKIEILKDKPYIKTFNNQQEWDNRFKYVFGVDPIPDRDPEEITLYVKNEFKNRFEKQPLAQFKISEQPSDLKGYSVITIKIKHNKELERKLLSYGNDIIVIAPQKIRTIVSKVIKKLNQIYLGGK